MIVRANQSRPRQSRTVGEFGLFAAGFLTRSISLCGQGQRPAAGGPRFRLVAATIGFSRYGEGQNTPLVAFAWRPIYQRFFLGDEFTIRALNVRSISPIVRPIRFITDAQTSCSRRRDGYARLSGLPRNVAPICAVFTARPETTELPASFTAVGGDTQILAQLLRYLVSIFGPVSLAAFADVGSSFNIRTATTNLSSISSAPYFLSTLGPIPSPRKSRVVT